MTIPVLWLSYHQPDIPAKGYWDTNWVERLFEGQLWHSRVQWKHCYSFEEVGESQYLAVVFPAKCPEDIHRLNKDLSRYERVFLILTSDEAGNFPAHQIEHPTLALWIMNPRGDRHKHFSKGIGNGWPPQAWQLVKYFDDYMAKTRKWSFIGQVNHSRRVECANVLRHLSDGYLKTNDKFADLTNGAPPELYYRVMADSVIVPCPAGVVSPDSFRVFEALEAGCIPLVDEVSPVKEIPPGYWDTIFGADHPLPLLPHDMTLLPKVIAEQYCEWQYRSIRIYSWWQQEKRKLVRSTEAMLGGIGFPWKEHPGEVCDRITVLIPVSPIPAHPDTAILDNTIASVRRYPALKDATIILMLDGVREEQKHREAVYTETVRKLLWRCNFEWQNVLPVVFESHHHQVAMTRTVLQRFVTTPHILFVEQDTPLVNDVPWGRMLHTLEEGVLDIIRLPHEQGGVHPEHTHMSRGNIEHDGVLYTRTIQWSQRPHLARVPVYKRLLVEHFSPNARTFIEDKMHSVCQCNENLYKIGMFIPEDGFVRSKHTDGRGEDPKFEVVF